VRRMGVHEAHHLDPTNRLIHWLCIPLELAALLKLLALAPTPVDLGLIAIAIVGLLYVVTDVIGGLAMVVFLLVLRLAATSLASGTPWVDALVAAATFSAAFGFQTRVGHGIFERGIDDTAMNLAELRRTRNPIPLVLIFYYHALELLFAAGYRPTLAATMHAYRARTLAGIPNDPRPR
jgi:uncharacterized membrane protein YGL010W